jgi:uncharacterized protein YdeI (YjbR/CyaY-like superfamily)
MVSARVTTPQPSSTRPGNSQAAISSSHRKEWVRWVEEAKKADTRATRLAKTVESLRAGKRAR